MIEDGKILVTGGAGFIGSALVWALNQRGFEDIIVTDVLGRDDKWKNLVPLRFQDYLESDQLFDQLDSPRLADIGTIFHLGAQSATTEQDARYLALNNYDYTRRLAEWSIRHERRFVYASSAATYGDGSQGMKDDVAELDRLRPLNMYGYSKHLFDKHARSKGWLDRIVGLKYFNVFGPNEAHKGSMRSVVHKSFEQIRDSGRVKLFRSHHPDYRDGEQMRDFLYVKDAVEMTIHLADTPGANGLYNLGSGQAQTWKDLVEPVFTTLNLPIQIDFIDMPESIREKYQYYTCADTARLRETGWPGNAWRLAEAVRDYVGGYLVDDGRLGDEGEETDSKASP
ncbi:MAG: ADP-glyceromanno-heptose 6-epimerase [Planctomycetota bacterium]